MKYQRNFERYFIKRLLVILWSFQLLVPPMVAHGVEYPFSFTDSAGKEITLKTMPSRVVSLVPSVTEMLIRIGAAERVVGVTHHSVLPPETAGKEVVGGFFQPDLDRVAELGPDVIFYSGLHSGEIQRFDKHINLIQLSPNTLADSESHLLLLGDIFAKEAEATRILTEERRLMALIRNKTAKIETAKQLRVMRLMGRESLMTPGDDSFQNEYIRAAGAIPPALGKNGAVVPVSLGEWQKFNPQFLYGCGDDRQILKLLAQPGWNEVEAIKNANYAFSPCDLTCRASTHTGYFIAWLAATIYQEDFSDPTRQVLPEKVVSRSPLDLELDYVERAEIWQSDIRDFRSKSVVIEFNEPMLVVSTLDGQRETILRIGNHYFPPPAWGLGHKEGFELFKNHNYSVLDLNPQTTSFLFTGADMDNLAVVKKSFKEMEVTALVTAGVASNAVRMAKDAGLYYEPEHQNLSTKPGTINILILTNMQLTPRAMTRAIISATEAKSAALQDLDIRSTYTSGLNPATGTGTDNVLVAEGRGLTIDGSGGHTKMGELIGRAVYDGVREAVRRQNGFTEKRTIFQRLRERHIQVRELAALSGEGMAELGNELERLLLDPAYSSFIEAAMAISDDYERGLVKDLSAFERWCSAMSAQLAGSAVQPLAVHGDMPVVLAKAFGALLAGLNEKE